MRAKTKEMLNKANCILEEGIPISGKKLAGQCGLKVGSAYRIVRMLRAKNIGIIPTKEGYLLSNIVNKKHIVGWTRKLLGRRTSDAIAVNAAYNDMIKMWHGDEKAQFIRAISFIMPSSSLSTSLRFIEDKSERLGI